MKGEKRGEQTDGKARSREGEERKEERRETFREEEMIKEDKM